MRPFRCRTSLISGCAGQSGKPTVSPILLAGVDLGRFVHMMLFPHPLMSYQIRLLGTLFSLGLPSHEDVPRDMENNAYAFFGERRGWGGGGVREVYYGI